MSAQPGRIAYRGAIARFESPNAKPLAIRQMPFAEAVSATILDLDLQRRWLHARFLCGPEYLQGAGVIQGGVLATMLDLSMAFVSLAVLPAELNCATAQLNVHYLRPAFPGEFHAESEVEKLGKRVLFNRATVRPADGGEPVASATAVFTVLGPDA